jgi:drug/metabolite transporter (DMT)-like permease
MKPIVAIFWLVILNVIWGFSFPFMDYLLGEMSVFMLLFIRFSISSIILLAIFYKQLLQMSKKEFKRILIISIAYLLGMYFQVIGLSKSSSTNTAFITSLTVIILPIILKVLDKHILAKKMILGIAIATVGISLMTLQSNMTFSRGDIIVFLGTICFAFLYYFLGKYGNQVQTGALTIIQFVIISFVSGIFVIWNGDYHVLTNTKSLFMIVFLIIFCTIVASLLHNKVQHYVPTAFVGIIFLLEPIAASTLAWLMGETITIRQGLGAIIVIISVLFTIEMAKSDKDQEQAILSQVEQVS